MSKRKRGRYIRARDAQGRYDDIAIDATVRQAAPHQRERAPSETAVSIRDQDLQRKVRVHKTGNLVVLLATPAGPWPQQVCGPQGAIISLLVDAPEKETGSP